MQVILLEDVKQLGKKGDTVKVNDGYARNFILPKKLGLEATPKNLNDLKLKKMAEEKQQKALLDDAKALADKINKGSVTVKIKTGESGKAFGSISTKEIAAALKEQVGCDIDKKKLNMTEPIKSLGTYSVSVKIHPKVAAELKVVVEQI